MFLEWSPFWIQVQNLFHVNDDQQKTWIKSHSIIMVDLYIGIYIKGARILHIVEDSDNPLYIQNNQVSVSFFSLLMSKNRSFVKYSTRNYQLRYFPIDRFQGHLAMVSWWSYLLNVIEVGCLPHLMSPCDNQKRAWRLNLPRLKRFFYWL